MQYLFCIPNVTYGLSKTHRLYVKLIKTLNKNNSMLSIFYSYMYTTALKFSVIEIHKC